jgi:outer membrane murein-binding lipoprotein Lpp
MTTPSRDLTIHWYEGDISPIEGKLNLLMAQVDDLSQKFTALDTSVRGLLSRVSASESALQSEIDALKADDAIEDSKLDGLSAAADDLRGAVDAFSSEAALEPPVTPGEPPTGEPAPGEPPPA